MVFWINWWLKNCEKPKKLKVFLVFHCTAKKKLKPQTSKNQKKLEFFWFFTIFKPSIYPKTKKNLGFFSFFKVKTQKKTKKNQGKPKKTKHEPQTKHSLKSFGFLVFWFSRSFFDFVNRVSPKSLQILFPVGFLKVFWFFGFSLWILSKIVVKYCFLFPTCFDSVHSYYPQDIWKKI